jgi:hypothetical protein
VRQHAKPYDPAEIYSRKPLAVDVTEGKTHPVYKAHAYHTKVPHLAIVPSILHYTEPGDLVLDGFAGAGMTGIAAQWCGMAPESYRVALEESWATEGIGRPRWGLRYSIQNDLSPIASFIAGNYSLPLDVGTFAEAARDLLDDVEKEIGWMYETLHTDGKTRGRIEFTVWSEVFSCPECAGEVAFTEEALDKVSGRIREVFPCPHCGSELTKVRMQRLYESQFDPAINSLVRVPKREPPLIVYSVGRATHQKVPDISDLELLSRISRLSLPLEVPTDLISPMHMTHERARMDYSGITHVHHFFLRRPAHALAALWRRADAHTEPRIRHMLLYFVEQALWTMSVLNRYRPTGFSQVNQYLSGVYYVASQHSECSPWYVLNGKLNRLVQTFEALGLRGEAGCISTASTTASLEAPSNSVDYVFTDPPFGENIYYADLNFLVESWHKVLTNPVPEAIVDRFKKKGLPEYQQLMQRCFEEYRRVLKPGRWITVVFHNSKNAVWTAIQEAMLAAGFVVADVRTMDKQQGSYRQVTSTAVKQDLVISAYKPNSGLEERFELERGTEEGVWDFIRTHLRQLPISVVRDARIEVIIERQPHLLFDRMVAFHVLRNVTVPLSAGEFLVALAQRFPERDGMIFLSDQVAEYDRRRMAIKEVAQLEIFVIDESSAIQWLRQRLGQKPQTFQEVHPQFLREIAGWQKHEKLPELSEMLEENFLSYDGNGEVPSQIHGYLSSNFKELRNLPKDHPGLRARARNRWYVADPRKAGDLEKLRERILLREFDGYRDSAQRKLKLFRLEAMRAGFRRAWQDRNYQTIIAVAQKIPETVLQEDQKLLMWYDQALTRTDAA